MVCITPDGVQKQKNYGMGFLPNDTNYDQIILGESNESANRLLEWAEYLQRNMEVQAQNTPTKIYLIARATTFSET